MIQTEKETIREDEILEELETREHLVDTAGEMGNITAQKIAQYGEKDVESMEKALQTKTNNSSAPTTVFRRVIQQ